MKKIRKGTQLKLTNPKNAGRPAIQDRGIRHTKREVIFRPSPTHLTIKLNKADIQNKFILKGLRHAIMRARLQGLRIVHYSLEYNHVHIYAEVTDNLSLAKGMKALGVSLVKISGSCYKTRYHLRILRSASEVKNVLNYILKNGIKHRRTKSVIDPYNSALVLHDFKTLGVKLNPAEKKLFTETRALREVLREVLDELELFKKELKYV